MHITFQELLKTYIYILEDGTVKIGPEPTEDDLQMCDGGYLEVINPSDMTTYYEGNWVDLEKIQPTP